MAAVLQRVSRPRLINESMDKLDERMKASIVKMMHGDGEGET